MATIPASENVFPLLRMAEVAAPSTPPTGEAHLYVKSDGLLYWKDDGGTEYAIGTDIANLADHLADTSDAHDASAISFSPTGTVAATDVQAAIAEVASEAAAGGISPTIVDAAGDLIVGSAADTVARLAMGGAGGHVSRINGAVAWDSGTSFPTAATGDRYWRTDLGMAFYYDGTRWLSLTLYKMFTSGAISSTFTTIGWRMPVANASLKMWLVAMDFVVGVFGTNNGSNYWTYTLDKRNSADTGTTIVTKNTSAVSASTWTHVTDAIGAECDPASHFNFIMQATVKTGSPANLNGVGGFTYRLIAA